MSNIDVNQSFYQNIDSLEFRNIIGRFTTGVSVITTHANGKDFGLTASAVSSLSLEPPTLLVCINQSAGTCHAISETKKFVVNILSENQNGVARQFAIPSDDKFKDIPVLRTQDGIPYLENCHVSIECELVEEFIGGTHKIFVGKATKATVHEQMNPLVYYRGKFGEFKLIEE
ncbi:flavin reductase family protein [Lysinibacillus endophyticus]|uniref:flavin reductase family protein n=1 Tax=Ureibacillus endophyticus TaxID=1978490 RepID=UPI003137607B